MSLIAVICKSCGSYSALFYKNKTTHLIIYMSDSILKAVLSDTLASGFVINFRICGLQDMESHLRQRHCLSKTKPVCEMLKDENFCFVRSTANKKTEQNYFIHMYVGLILRITLP